MGIRIVEGRRPKPGDEDVYIFNEFTRKKYPWLKVDQPAPDDNLVIGFCENIKYSSFRNDDTNQTMAFLIPGKKFAQWGWEWRNFVNVRISAGADKVEVIRSLQKTMEKFTPGHDFNFRFMDEVLDANYRNELRFTKQILLFSLIAIAISLTGVFGLTMFESEYRKKESESERLWEARPHRFCTCSTEDIYLYSPDASSWQHRSDGGSGSTGCKDLQKKHPSPRGYSFCHSCWLHSLP